MTVRAIDAYFDSLIAKYDFYHTAKFIYSAREQYRIFLNYVLIKVHKLKYVFRFYDHTINGSNHEAMPHYNEIFLDSRSGDDSDSTNRFSSYLLFLRDKDVVYPFLVNYKGLHGHTFLLIYRSKSNTLEYYDPNFRSYSIEDDVFDFFERVSDRTGVTFIYSDEIHPNDLIHEGEYTVSINSLVQGIKDEDGITRGLCQIISVFIAHLVLKFPELTTEQVIRSFYERCLIETFSAETATKIVLGFFFSYLDYLKKDMVPFQIDSQRLARMHKESKGPLKLFKYVMSYLRGLEYSM
jgi:hypothetical protein